MGIPQRYSVDLPKRCLRLIQELLPRAAKTHIPGEEHLGPLTTTFLLAMSTPMITLPIERLERHLCRIDEGYADDRFLAPRESEVIARTLGGAPVRNAPFFEAGAWAFASIPYRHGMNLARHIPAEATATLASDEGRLAAQEMPASQWASCLRNALSHGGIFYLDQAGLQIFGGKAEKLAFASGKYNRKTDELEGLNVLCISEAAYLRFLSGWVDWLEASGVLARLAAE